MYDKALLARLHNTCQSYCTLVAQLACGPTVTLSKPPASSGFIYRAGSCQAHRPQGWSVNGKEDLTPIPGFGKGRKTTATKSSGFSLCEIPAAVQFKELTCHWYNVRTLTKHTTFDLDGKFYSVGWGRGYRRCGDETAAVAPGDWAGAEEWVSNSTVSGISLRYWAHPQGDKMRWCVKQEGAEFQQRAQAGSSQLLSQGRWLDHKFLSQGETRVWGKEEFWLLYAWQSCFFYNMGCWKQKQNSSDMHIWMMKRCSRKKKA